MCVRLAGGAGGVSDGFSDSERVFWDRRDCGGGRDWIFHIYAGAETSGGASAKCVGGEKLAGC